MITIAARTWIIMEALVSLRNLCSLRAAIARSPVCITIADSYTWRYTFLAEWLRACFCILIEAASLLIYSKSFLASRAAGFDYIICQFQVRPALLALRAQSAQSSEEIPLQNFWDWTEAFRKLTNSFRIRCVFIRLWISRAALANTSALRASNSAIWPALKNTFVFPIWYKEGHKWGHTKNICCIRLFYLPYSPIDIGYLISFQTHSITYCCTGGLLIRAEKELSSVKPSSEKIRVYFIGIFHLSFTPTISST